MHRMGMRCDVGPGPGARWKVGRLGWRVLRWGLLGAALGGGARVLGQTKAPVSLPKGVWTAESPLAMAMTGDLRVGAGTVGMVGHSFVLKNGVALTGEALQVARRMAGVGEGATGMLLHTREVGDETSRLCGARPVRWMLFVTKGREMQMVVFAGERRINLLTPEEREQRLCGVYQYAQPR